MKRFRVVVVLMSVFAASLGTAPTAHSAAAPAVTLMLTGDAVEAQLEVQVVGTGIEGIVPVRRGVVPAGELIWVKIRDRVDYLGMRHVFYQQHLLPAGLTEPVRLAGAEVGLHYEPSGDLRSVYGTQYEAVEVAADLLVADGYSAEAFATVSESAAALGLLPARDVFPRDPGTPELLLEPFEKGFRYVWEVPMRARGVGRRIAIVDGTSGAILTVEDRTPWSECASQSSTRVYAKAEPQKPEPLGPVDLGLSLERPGGVVHARRSPFSHDGHPGHRSLPGSLPRL